MKKLFFTLPEDLKIKFEQEYNLANLNNFRFSLFAGLALYCLFGILDGYLLPDGKILSIFYSIRYLFITPLVLFTILYSYIGKLKYLQLLLAFTTFWGGIGIVAMILIAPQHIANNYYAGLILILIYLYTFLRPKVSYSIIAGWTVFFVYELSVLFYLDTPKTIFINNSFFFFFTNVIGTMYRIMYENHLKKEFYNAYLLKISTEELDKNNELLEDRIRKRTIELSRKNDQLYREIEKKIKFQKELEKATETAEKANTIKSNFLAQMSHEIRSPINTIVNNISLISELIGEEDEIINSSFDGINIATKRVIRTIDLILNTSEIQLGTYIPSFREVDLVTLIKNLNKEYLRIAESKKINLKINCFHDELIVYTDDYALGQIIANLIDNAIKYTSIGMVSIDLKKNINDDIYVYVSDTGRGIDEKYLPYLFNQFTQESSGYSRRFDGNGLGLSLVKEYCDLIGIKISVKSKLNEGTTFILKFDNKTDAGI